MISFSLAIRSPAVPFQASAPSTFSAEPMSPSNSTLTPLPFMLVGLVLVGSIIASIVPLVDNGPTKTVFVGIVSSSQLTVICVSSKLLIAKVPTTLVVNPALSK